MTATPRPFDRSRIGILVVEDEPLLLMDAMDMIEDAGFTVYGASHAARALELLEQHDNIRILFTDIDMPGTMDGLKLAHAVRERWPPVSVIVTSGHVRIGSDQMPAHGVFLSKPYRPASLVDALDALTQVRSD
ncbi:response regulator [Aureimonas jatrophae]|uniref:Response regulator receiver domain-containing protein n=1 Tax=Aureimonas jatrophae TaxID=1166073 RepID=A0A1H0C686_9HYPH|nr:response regulator [Aureimonas jatrophae]MBB3949085.1 CheY-like chemotaxis protein [Aureimonas jatrophae]SDN53362.1 Response regulator receiver domain-containing protein [Aureimonas jatrophae]